MACESRGHKTVCSFLYRQEQGPEEASVRKLSPVPCKEKAERSGVQAPMSSDGYSLCGLAGSVAAGSSTVDNVIPPGFPFSSGGYSPRATERGSPPAPEPRSCSPSLGTACPPALPAGSKGRSYSGCETILPPRLHLAKRSTKLIRDILLSSPGSSLPVNCSRVPRLVSHDVRNDSALSPPSSPSPRAVCNASSPDHRHVARPSTCVKSMGKIGGSRFAVSVRKKSSTAQPSSGAVPRRGGVIKPGCVSTFRSSREPSLEEEVIPGSKESVEGRSAVVLSQHGAKRKHLADIYPAKRLKPAAGRDQVRLSRATRVVLTPVLHTGPPDVDRLRESLKSTKDRAFWVKQTLKFFDQYRRYLVQKGMGGRVDLEVRSFMKQKGLTLNETKRSGAVPGVEVGQQFFYRWELEIVGVHFTAQSGIDTASTMNVATSIIFSGGYEDDVDDGESIEFTGQGGNDYSGTRRQQTDQQLIRGNMAMKKAFERCCPIRVTRGHDNEKSPSKKLYTYDGLYKITKCAQVTGISGHKVWKFYLTRIPGQPPLSSEKVYFTRNKKGNVDKRTFQIDRDISGRKEMMEVPVVNEVDNEVPLSFKYCSSVKYPRELVKPVKQGCQGCHGACSDKKCGCLARNGGEWPYTPDGTLVRAQPIIYECNHLCSCNEKSCPNRVTQKGMKFQLEVFRTRKKGWGVRSWDCIPAGSFICEFAGELIDSDEYERREGNDLYMFSLDFGQGASTRWGTEFEKLSVAETWQGKDRKESKSWYIDANKCGSVARFVNHSCSPNAFTQYVLHDHSDVRFPHVMIFASEMIPAFTEISLDYGLYSSDNYGIVDANGNLRSQHCYCGSSVCRGRVY